MSLIQSLRSSRGATMVEFALVVVPLAALLFYFVDLGLALYRYSTLTHATAELSRHLSVELGRAWQNGGIAQGPWNGSCNQFLKIKGDDYLSTLPGGGYSATDTDGTFYFGSTMDDSTALVTDPDAPYAILRIVGTNVQQCLACSLLPAITLRTESSVLVEYHSTLCNDY